MTDSIRDSINAAIEESENDENQESSAEEESSTEGESTESASEGQSSPETSSSNEAEGSAEESEKGAEGAEGSSGESGAESSAEEQSEVSVSHETKAPQSWTPKDREDWGKLPPNVQAQVTKREKEIVTMLEKSSDARKQMASFNEMLTPYQSMFAAQGVNATQGIDNVLQMAAALQGGTPQQKAETAARIIRDFGVDIKSLDGILVGKSQQSQASPEYQQLNNEVQQMRQHFNQQQQNEQYQRQQQQQTESDETKAFINDPKNEFVRDVMADMADLMDLSQNRGVKLSLKDAYDRAVGFRPDLQEIINSRQAQQTNQQAVQNARQANVSLPQNSESAAPSKPPTSLRGLLEAGWDNN